MSEFKVREVSAEEEKSVQEVEEQLLNEHEEKLGAEEKNQALHLLGTSTSTQGSFKQWRQSKADPASDWMTGKSCVEVLVLR